MYSEARSRDYEWLKARLNHERLRLSRDEFVAILNVITNCDEFGFSKTRAIKMSSSNLVTQKRIKDILKSIDYKTQKEIRKTLNTKGYNESQDLLEIMANDDVKEMNKEMNKEDKEVMPFGNLYKQSNKKKLKGIYLDEDISNILSELGEKGGRGTMSEIVNEVLRKTFKQKGLL